MSAQRKLADAEAALKKAKEEARRATAEVERAKAEAKNARESEAAVKRKLADAEAARAKAEQACRSDTTRSGLGGRLRRWLGRPHAKSMSWDECRWMPILDVAPSFRLPPVDL